MTVAPLRIWSGGAVRAGLVPAAALYSQRGGVPVAIEFQPMGPLTKRLASDALPDMVVLAQEVMERAQERRLVSPETCAEVARVAIGVAVGESAPVPDIATPETFCRAVLAAKSLIYIDPERGTSGAHVANVLRRLGIAEAVEAKTVFGRDGAVVEPVARGEIELGIHQMTAMMEVPGVRIVGPLPEALQKVTIYVGAASATTPRRAAVVDFLNFLQTSEIRRMFEAKGFTAGPAGDRRS